MTERFNGQTPSDCDMSGYDLTKASERYRWKCDQTREIVERLHAELCDKAVHHVVTVDDKCVLSTESVDIVNFRSVVYRLFGISLE